MPAMKLSEIPAIAQPPRPTAASPQAAGMRTPQRISTLTKGRVADFAQAVQVVHNAVEHRIAPGERQHHKNIPLGHRQHRGVPGEKAEHRPPERREQQPAGQRERPAAQRDAQRAFAQAVGQAGAEVLAGKDRKPALENEVIAILASELSLLATEHPATNTEPWVL